MSQETGSIDLARLEPADHRAASSLPARPLGLVRLAIGTVAIGIGALVIACLIAVGLVLVLYLRFGTDGLTELYQELRFDFRLRILATSIVVGLLYIGAATATVCVAVASARKGWPALIGWARVRERHRLLPAIFVVTLLYAIAATLRIALSQNTPVIVSGSTDLVLVCTFVLNLIVLAPVAEELFFRGWLYTGLRNRFSFWPSFLATAALFAAIHWYAGRSRILLVLPLALALGVLREVTGSIKPTIALHVAYNTISIVITIAVTLMVA